MTHVLVIGAHGQIARTATDLFLQRSGVNLTLYLRRAGSLDRLVGHSRVRIVGSDAIDVGALAQR
jgi:saccharopine dehydrogenase-like NADP-dependent oxidoreductase